MKESCPVTKNGYELLKKELKQLIRDMIDPNKSLGHSDS